MEQIVKCLLLKNDAVLITEIVEVGADIGEPNCKLTNPFVLKSNPKSIIWNLGLTSPHRMSL